MLPILRIGPMALPTNGVLILFTAWFAIWLAERHSKHYQIEAKKLDNLIIVSIVAAILASRIFYILRFPQIFIDKPIDIVSLNTQMLDIWGGLLSGGLIFVILAQKRKMPIWNLLDCLSPIIPVIGMGLGLSTLADGSLFGIQTELPWGIYLWGMERHPVQFYQFIGSVGIFCLYLIEVHGFKKTKFNQKPGMVFLVFLSMGAALQIVVDAFRAETQMFGSFHLVQLISFAVLILAFYRIDQLKKNGDQIDIEEA